MIEWLKENCSYVYSTVFLKLSHQTEWLDFINIPLSEIINTLKSTFFLRTINKVPKKRLVSSATVHKMCLEMPHIFKAKKAFESFFALNFLFFFSEEENAFFYILKHSDCVFSLNYLTIQGSFLKGMQENLSF